MPLESIKQEFSLEVMLFIVFALAFVGFCSILMFMWNKAKNSESIFFKIFWAGIPIFILWDVIYNVGIMGYGFDKTITVGFIASFF